MNPFSYRPERRLAALALAALALTAGCVKQDAPGMEVVALDAEIIFGIAEAAPPAAEPLAFVPEPVKPRTPAQLAELPEAPELPQPPDRVRTPPPPAPERSKYVCPSAGLGEFPQAAPVDVSGQPAQGTYRWRPGPPTVVDTDHFEVEQKDLFDRIVFNVSRVTESINPEAANDPSAAPIRTFTYQVATYAGSTVVLDTFRVVSGGVTESAGAVNFGPTFYTGQPDRGVSLVSRQVIENNRVVAAFNPSTPVLLLPLPAIGGATFQSVSYDPVYGTTYMLYGEVKERARVDACGKEMDGWRVVAQTALRDPRDGATAPPRTATLTYFIATGAGGIVTHEARSKLALPRFPVNGTPLDGATPPNPAIPDNASTAAAYEFSLATREPSPITRPTPQPQGPLGGN